MSSPKKGKQKNVLVNVAATLMSPHVPDWVEGYGYTGDIGGRRSSNTLKRKATVKNPWNSVKNRSVRLARRTPSADALPVLLDAIARQSPWYYLDVERDSAVAVLEDLMSDLVEGSFVVTTSRKDFAMLTFITKGNLFNVPIDADADGLFLKSKELKSPPRFQSMSALVMHYSAKKQKGLPCKLDTVHLENALMSMPTTDQHDEYLEIDTEVEPTSSPVNDDSGAGSDEPAGRRALDNPGYKKMSAREEGMENPKYTTETKNHGKAMANAAYDGVVVGGPKATGAYYEIEAMESPELYASKLQAKSPGSADDADSNEGYITISQMSFCVTQGIFGVTFQPCQNNEWFFMGVSNCINNHHGGRDQHYDDIDYCIGVMGHGKATARENEDEVGPYVEYKEGDTFTIRVNVKASTVEFGKNKKIFHISSIEDPKQNLWAVQAFHPINGTTSLIKNSSWLKKYSCWCHRHQKLCAMHFGKTLRKHIENCDQCDEQQYVDYTMMKKLIKSKCTPQEFQRVFHGELFKVSEALRNGHALQVDPDFVAINKTALDKISKKFDKKNKSEIRQLNSKVAGMTLQSSLRTVPADLASESEAVDTSGKLGIQLTPTQITFCAGGVSGVVSRCCTAPLDRIKILMQADAGKFGKRQRDLLDAAKYVYKDGGVRGFWRGNFANVLKVVPESATRFLMYDIAKRQICKDPSSPEIKERFLAGCTAGATSQTLVYPLDVIKTRLAASSKGDYNGIWHCLIRSVRKEGFRALYKGLGPAVMGIVPAAGVDLAVYNTLRDYHANYMATRYREELNRHVAKMLDLDISQEPNVAEFPQAPVTAPPIILSLFFGAVSATCGALIAYPLTLVRTKLATQGMLRVPTAYNGMFDCMRHVYNTSGWRGFYRGLTPSLLKTVPAISIGYGAFELAKRVGTAL